MCEGADTRQFAPVFVEHRNGRQPCRKKILSAFIEYRAWFKKCRFWVTLAM